MGYITDQPGGLLYVGMDLNLRHFSSLWAPNQL